MSDVDPADPALYERDQPLDLDPDGPDVNGWKPEQITYDCPTWKAPNGDRVKVVRQSDKYPLFAAGEAIKHGSYERADSIAKAVEWMRENPAPEEEPEPSSGQSDLGRWADA